MPEVEDASVLSPVLELLHVNFRELRQSVEHEIAHLRSQVLSGAQSPDSLVERLAALRTDLRAAKATHLHLVATLRARVHYWTEYEEHGSARGADGSAAMALGDAAGAAEVDLPFVVQIANYLAERGCFESALAGLLESRPEIKPLVDTGVIAEEHALVHDFEHGNVNALLKWCRVHRSALKRGGSKLELDLQLRKFKELAKEGRSAEAMVFARKSFNRTSPVDFAAIVDSSAVLYGGIEDPDGAKSAEELADEIRRAVRMVYRRPKQNPLVNNVLLGAAAVKTRRCAPGSQALAPQNHKLPRACPLCRSIKMQPLFDAVPYAQHTRSHLDADLKKFPSGVVFGLEAIAKFMKTHYSRYWARDKVVDPHAQAVIFIDELESAYAL